MWHTCKGSQNAMLLGKYLKNHAANGGAATTPVSLHMYGSPGTLVPPVGVSRKDPANGDIVRRMSGSMPSSACPVLPARANIKSSDVAIPAVY